jgi:hypothetical protein
VSVPGKFFQTSVVLVGDMEACMSGVPGITPNYYTSLENLPEMHGSFLLLSVTKKKSFITLAPVLLQRPRVGLRQRHLPGGKRLKHLARHGTQIVPYQFVVKSVVNHHPDPVL